MADEYLEHQLIWLLLHAIDHDIRPYLLTLPKHN